MEFHQEVPHGMAFQTFTDQPEISVGGGSSGGSGGPTWLDNAMFRQQKFLHLQAESESRNEEIAMATARKNGNCSDRRSCGGEEEEEEEEEEEREEEEEVESESARFKADVVGHPLYEQLLSAHVSCLRIATPVDQLPKIDAQLAHSRRVVAKYSAIGIPGGVQVVDEKDLDQFMVCLLKSFAHSFFSFEIFFFLLSVSF